MGHQQTTNAKLKREWVEELGLLVPIIALIAAIGVIFLRPVDRTGKESELLVNNIRQLMANNAEVSAFQPLTLSRKIKKELDVYFDPSTSIRTETGRFVPIHGPDGKVSISQGEIEQLLSDQNTLVGFKTRNGVIAINDPSLHASFQRREDFVRRFFELAKNAQTSDAAYGVVVREAKNKSSESPADNVLSERGRKLGSESVISWGKV